MTISDLNPSNRPSGGPAAPAGFIAPPKTQHEQTTTENQRRQRLEAIANILKDPLKVQELSQRVYHLLQADFTIQQERGGRY